MRDTNVIRLAFSSLMLVGIVACSGNPMKSMSEGAESLATCDVQCQAIKKAVEPTGWSTETVGETDKIYIFSKELSVEGLAVPTTMQVDLAELDNPEPQRLTVFDIDVPIVNGQPDFEPVRDQLLDKGLSETGLDQIAQAIQTLMDTLKSVQA